MLSFTVSNGRPRSPVPILSFDQHFLAPSQLGCYAEPQRQCRRITCEFLRVNPGLNPGPEGKFMRGVIVPSYVDTWLVCCSGANRHAQSCGKSALQRRRSIAGRPFPEALARYSSVLPTARIRRMTRANIGNSWVVWRTS